MRRVKWPSMVVCILLTFLLGCGDFKAKSEYQKGMKLQKCYEYQAAINKYEAVVSNYSKTQWADSAQSAIEQCEKKLRQIEAGFDESARLLAKGKYEEAEEKIRAILDIGVSEEISAKIQQRLSEVDKAKKSSFEYIAKVVMERMNRGASSKVALGEFAGLKVKWEARPGSICWGLNRRNPPVAFKIGKVEFFGTPSYGLDRLKFLMFCEANEGKLVTVEGTLISASDWPGVPLIVEVNALSRK